MSQKVISAFSNVGTAIRKNIPFVLHRPTTEDMFPDTDVRMYNFVPTILAEDEEAPPRILDTTSHSAYTGMAVSGDLEHVEGVVGDIRYHVFRSGAQGHLSFKREGGLEEGT